MICPEMMDVKRSKKQLSESYLIGAVLAVVGGYLDAYTYLARGQVFANAQTGNIVLLGLNLYSGNFMKVLFYFLPISAFVLGIVICEVLRKYGDHFHFHWRQYVIFLELAAVAAVSFMPQGYIDHINCDMIANITISFVCSLQVQSFRNIRGITCATTMCTGNLRSGTDYFMQFLYQKDHAALHKAGKYYGIVGFFIIGAVISSFVTRSIGALSSIVCAGFLLLVFLLLFIRPQNTTP